MVIKIGDRVKVVDQDIVGEVIRFDWNGDVVILDDHPEWAAENEEPSLVYKQSELEIIK